MRRLLAILAGLSLVVSACGGQNGVQSSSVPPMSSPTTVGFVAATYGAPWSAALAAGLSDGAKRFGGSVNFEIPTSPVPSDQVNYAEEQVVRHPSAVGVLATDPTALCPTAEIARRAGVLFYAAGSDVACPGVGLFVEPAAPQAIGFAAVDNLAAEVHGTGDVAIVSAGATEPDLQAWVHYMQIRLARYPRLHLVPVQTGAITSSDNTAVADRLMDAYPDLKGMIGAGPANVAPLASAVEQAGEKGKIAVTGVTDPNTARRWIEDGTVGAVVYYDVVHLGYLTYWAVKQALNHRSFAASQHVPGLQGAVTWSAATHTLLLGPPVVITKANVNKLNY